MVASAAAVALTTVDESVPRRGKADDGTVVAFRCTLDLCENSLVVPVSVGRLELSPRPLGFRGLRTHWSLLVLALVRMTLVSVSGRRGLRTFRSPPIISNCSLLPLHNYGAQSLDFRF